MQGQAHLLSTVEGVCGKTLMYSGTVDYYNICLSSCQSSQCMGPHCLPQFELESHLQLQRPVLRGSEAHHQSRRIIVRAFTQSTGGRDVKGERFVPWPSLTVHAESEGH